MRDLPSRVNPRIGSPSYRKARALRLTEQHRKRRLKLSLHGAQAGLSRPAVKVGSVVGQVESQSSHVDLSLPSRVAGLLFIPRRRMWEPEMIAQCGALILLAEVPAFTKFGNELLDH